MYALTAPTLKIKLSLITPNSGPSQQNGDYISNPATPQQQQNCIYTLNAVLQKW